MTNTFLFLENNLKPESVKKAYKRFQATDKDKSGLVDYTEFCEILQVDPSPQCEGVFQLLEGDDEANLRIEIDHEIHMANEALRDENAPAIERALARIEAALIAADPRSMPEMIAAPAEIIATGEDFLTIDERETSGELARIAPNQNDLDDVPFVDLTASVSEEE